jgi:hypothetical protein
MIGTLMNFDTCYGMETNVDKKMVMRFQRKPSLPEIMIDQRKQKNVEYFNRLVYLVKYLHVKFNVGFLWQKHESTRKRRFLPAKFVLKFKE